MAETGENSVIVVAIDNSEHSFYALEWTLDHLIIPTLSQSLFKLIIVHTKPSATHTIGVAGAAIVDVMPQVEADLMRTAAKVVDKAKDLCTAKSVTDITFEVIEGDARNVLCDAVDMYNATMLVLGSHGYGAIKRAVLGSVSDYCAHHAHCSVMIVKKPKNKH